MTSPADSLSSRSDECGTDDPHKHTQPNLQHQPSPGILPLGMVPSSTQPMMPHGHPDIGHSMVPAGYPFVDPYYGSVIASLPEGQAAIHPYYVGVQPGLPLPSDAVEEPVYVNAKQYRGILRRRQSRAKAESENRLIKSRKPYLHESRHLHALKRARGCGGRFLTAKNNANENTSDASQDKASGCNNFCLDSQKNPEQPTTALGLNSSHLHNQQNAETRLVEEHNPEAVGKLDGSNVESLYKS